MLVAALVAACLAAQVATAPGTPAPAHRVACLGDSITWGARLEDRERHSYPAILGGLLGAGWEARNFGVGGATLLRAADRPITGTPEYAALLAWRPDTVVVMLGTNDTCDSEARPIWRGHAALRDDALALARELRERGGARRVLFCTPPRMFPERAGLAEERRTDLRERAPRLERIDATLHETFDPEDDGVEVVELDGVLRAEWTSDGVHPVPPGQEALALRVAAAVDPRLAEAPALLARPSVEWRGAAAGWGEGNWWSALDHLRAEAAAHRDAEIVFLGDSITQGLTGHAERAAKSDGTRAIDRAFGDRPTLSLGLSGDRTEHLLFRIRHGALPLLHPQVIVLQIGINNLAAAGHAAEPTAAGIAAVVDALRAAQPQARVVVCGPFPGGRAPDSPLRAKVDAVHARIAVLGTRDGVDLLDLRGLFLDADGNANERLGGDGIHITAAGQEAWMEAIRAFLDTRSE